MAKHGPRTPERWERYKNLNALIRAECCNYYQRRSCCLALGRECEIIKPTNCHWRWRSPMNRHAHHVPKPGPRTVTNAKAPKKMLKKAEKAQEAKEESGQGRCSWFEKALLPIVPGHLLDEYGQTTEKGNEDEQDEGTRDGHERDLERAGLDRDAAPPRRLPR